MLWGYCCFLLTKPTMYNVKGKKVLVMGLGLIGGGLTITKWLVKQNAHVTVTDLRSKNELRKSVVSLEKLPITWHLGKHIKKDFQEHDLIIQNPGVPSNSVYLDIARSHNIQILNEAGIFFLYARRPLIGITGTRGKSTTSTIVHALLKHRFKDVLFAGNIGDIPMFDVIDKAQIRSKSPIVLELSSWHVEGLRTIKKSPFVSVITNLMSDHLNRYPSKVAYHRSKMSIFTYQSSRDFAVFNYDNASSRRVSAHARSRLLWFSIKPLPKNMSGVYIQKDTIYHVKNGKRSEIMPVSTITLPGDHNVSNILSALLVAKLFNIPNKKLIQSISSLKALWGREQYVSSKKGITFYNDTTATNPEATIACIKTLPKPLLLIIGGENKNLTYSELAHVLNREVYAIVLLPGSASTELYKELKKIRSRKIIIKKSRTLTHAFKSAVVLSKKGSTVALSPAAASFNMFKNEFERGKYYIKLVNALR